MCIRENLREGRPQGAQLLALLGLNDLDLRGVAEALEELAELGLAFLRDLLPGREFLGPGRSHQLLGLRVADLQTNHPSPTPGSPRSAEPVTCTSTFDKRNGTCAHAAGTPHWHGEGGR